MKLRLNSHQENNNIYKEIIPEVDPQGRIGQKRKEESDFDELLSIEEANRFLKISRQTIYNWREKKMLKSYGRGNRIYFKKKDLLNPLNEINR